MALQPFKWLYYVKQTKANDIEIILDLRSTVDSLETCTFGKLTKLPHKIVDDNTTCYHSLRYCWTHLEPNQLAINNILRLTHVEKQLEVYLYVRAQNILESIRYLENKNSLKNLDLHSNFKFYS
jgi:hypothetical protein